MENLNVVSNKFSVLASWQEKKAELDRVKSEEAELRRLVVELFSEHEMDKVHKGTENVDVGQGYDLKIVHKLDYKLDNKNDYAELHTVLDKIEKDFEGGSVLADRLVKQEFKLSVSEYEKLPEAARKLVDRVLTIKPAAKTIELHKRAR